MAGTGSGLRDGTSFHNRSKSTPRRMSFSCSPSLNATDNAAAGGGAGGGAGVEPKKDRKAMLEEWRKQMKSKEQNTGTNQAAGGTGTPARSAAAVTGLSRPPAPSSSFDDGHDKKRARTGDGHGATSEGGGPTQPLPPMAPAPAPRAAPAPTPPLASSSQSAMEVGGGTALERFKARRALRQQREQKQTMGDGGGYEDSHQDQHHNHHQQHAMPPLPPAAATASSAAVPTRSTICYDDDDDDDYNHNTTTSTRPYSARSTPNRAGGTPLRGRNGRMSLAAGAARKTTSSRRKSMSAQKMTHFGSGSSVAAASAPAGVKSAPPPEPPVEHVNAASSDNNPLSQTSVGSGDAVEDAGMRSRIQEMQQRINQLEQEKMTLNISKAPLEARFRQKEDAWLKDQQKMLQEIESLKTESKERDDRSRELEERNENLEEEIRALRVDARKAASSLNSRENGSNDTWSRQLQNDRDVADLKEKLRHSEEEIKSLRLEKVSVESELSGTKMELISLTRAHDELQVEFEEMESSKSQNSEAEIQLEVLTTEHIAASAQLNAVCADLAATKSSAQAAMEAKEEEFKKEVEKLKFEMSVIKARGGVTDDDDDKANDDEVEDMAVLKARIEERDRRIAELEMELLKGEQLRRQMHNRIQELRGNIRVFVRARPFLPGDGQSTQTCLDVLPDGENLSIIDNRSGNPVDFKFDKVFPPSSGQDGVFEEVSEFVQSALDGYNVVLFSYGQTGSGKTHTMQGSGIGAMRGIIPRAVEQILSQAKIMQAQRWQFTVSASFLEIYNENLRDLLVNLDLRPDSLSSSCSSAARPASAAAQKLAIKRDRNQKSFVDGLTQHKIDAEDKEIGIQQLEALMAAAARARSVATTKMNAQSSRSHSVFMLHLHGINEDTGTIVEGSLNLCDLAGSERLDRSGAAADAKRLKETQAINKSLSCLGDVFNALGNGSPHVPYRNSKLTYLLQDCLSGDGKALMFVNLSPTMESGNESLCSLRFAQRVNSVELGKATKHVYRNH